MLNNKAIVLDITRNELEILLTALCLKSNFHSALIVDYRM